tara:strand:- start:39 stop:404 length:366 start_codon:yes stop_codon:yes gene_type:complete
MKNGSSEKYTFRSLNLWRQLWISFLWLGNTVQFSFTTYYLLTQKPPLSETVTMIVIFSVMFLFVFWNHIAVVERKLTQLKWIAFLHLIPFFNLVGMLIMFSIIRVTKNEIQQANVLNDERF